MARTIGSALRWAKPLSDQAEWALAELLSLPRSALYLNLNTALDPLVWDRFEKIVSRLVKNEPLEYIFGRTFFYGLDLSLSEETLIPRQETEWMIDTVVHSMLSPLEGKVLLDLCTGSGCCGLALKKTFPVLEVFLSDISPGAVEMAKKNAVSNGLEVKVLLGDFLQPFTEKKADYVLCNPPYISEKEYPFLEPSVRDFEPKRALVGGEDGLDFYRRLSRELFSVLNPGACIWFEIGRGQGEAVFSLFSDWPIKSVKILKDWAQHDRIFFLEIE